MGGKLADVPLEVPTQSSEPLANTLPLRLEDIPDEEMPDAADNFDSNFVPQNFPSRPGLTSSETFHEIAGIAGKKLEDLGISISKQGGTHIEDLEMQAKEVVRRMRIDGQLAPAERIEADNYDVAETLLILNAGYFFPGMPDLRQRQLAATLSVYISQKPNNTTPGAASNPPTNLIC